MSSTGARVSWPRTWAISQGRLQPNNPAQATQVQQLAAALKVTGQRAPAAGALREAVQCLLCRRHRRHPRLLFWANAAASLSRRAVCVVGASGHPGDRRALAALASSPGTEAGYGHGRLRCPRAARACRALVGRRHGRRGQKHLAQPEPDSRLARIGAGWLRRRTGSVRDGSGRLDAASLRAALQPQPAPQPDCRGAQATEAQATAWRPGAAAAQNR